MWTAVGQRAAWFEIEEGWSLAYFNSRPNLLFPPGQAQGFLMFTSSQESDVRVGIRYANSVFSMKPDSISNSRRDDNPLECQNLEPVAWVLGPDWPHRASFVSLHGFGSTDKRLDFEPSTLSTSLIFYI